MSWKIVGEIGTEDTAQQPSAQESAPQAVGEISQGREIPVLDTITQGRASGLLDRFVNQSAMDRVVNLASIGPMAEAAGAREVEEALPYVMGTIGGVLGAKVGKPNFGVGVGTSIGEAERQFVNIMKGQSEEMKPLDIFMKGAGTGAASKAVDLTLRAGGASLSLVPKEAREAFYNKIRQGVEVGHKILVRNYGKAVNRLAEANPTARVALNETMEKIGTALEGMVDDAGQPIISQIASAVKKNPRLADVVSNPSKAIGLTLKEAVELKSAVTSTVKSLLKRKAKGVTPTPAERNVFDIMKSFDRNITKNFPEMHQVNATYHAGTQAYDMVRPLLQRGSAVEASILSKPSGIFALSGSKLMGSTEGGLELSRILGGKVAKDNAKRMGQDKLFDYGAGEKLYRLTNIAHNLNRAADAVGRLAEVSAGGYVLKKYGLDKSDD